MNEGEVICLALCLFAMLFSIHCMGTAYRNGATDGYGYAKEPWNSGYQKAGHYLRESMSHRWPELKDMPKG